MGRSTPIIQIDMIAIAARRSPIARQIRGREEQTVVVLTPVPEVQPSVREREGSPPAVRPVIPDPVVLAKVIQTSDKTARCLLKSLTLTEITSLLPASLPVIPETGTSSVVT